MEIRPLRESDSRLAVSRIYEESWRFAYRGIVPQDYLDSISAGRWARALDGSGWGSLILTEKGTPVGTACVCPSRWPDYPDFGEVVSLYLLPEYVGRGYGKALLEAAEEALADRGFRDILLWVLEDNLRARRFYEKAGFTFRGKAMENEIGGKTLKELLYCRRIG